MELGIDSTNQDDRLKLSREVISVIRFENIPETPVGYDSRGEGQSYPLSLHKVNGHTILGKLRFYRENGSKKSPFESIPKRSEIEKWLQHCREWHPDNGFAPIVILKESVHITYELHYDLIPSVDGAIKLLGGLVDLALDFAEANNWSMEQCEERIGNRNRLIISSLKTIAKDSIRSDDSKFDHIDF